MADRKKPNPLKIVAGGKNSAVRPRPRRKPDRKNLRIPRIWLPYRAGHGHTARDRTIADKNFALLHVAAEERLGKPIRWITAEEVIASNPPRQCAFCQRRSDMTILIGPKGTICIKCVGTGLDKIKQKEPWPS